MGVQAILSELTLKEKASLYSEKNFWGMDLVSLSRAENTI
jgi:hypothetical protein